MANLSVRKLDKEVYEQLRVRAAKHGISMEEEARRILFQAVSTPQRITEVFQKQFGKKNGIQLKMHPRQSHGPMDFEE